MVRRLGVVFMKTTSVAVDSLLLVIIRSFLRIGLNMSLAKFLGPSGFGSGS